MGMDLRLSVFNIKTITKHFPEVSISASNVRQFQLLYILVRT